MINLGTHLESISSKFGYDLYLEDELDRDGKSPCIRFRIDSNLDTFHLKVSRSWKTTRVEFVLGAFANQVANYLCQEVLLHKSEISNLISNPSISVSEVALEIDNVGYEKVESLDGGSHTLKFHIEAMSPESSIEYGLLNEKEASLVELAISVIVTLLPKPSSTYSNPEEVVGFPEGATTQVLVNKYERDPRNRAEAISIHGYSCLACGFDFKQKYGDLGSEFIVVHHVVPVSKIGADYVINPANDLVTLCANCHAMIHRQDPPLTTDELRAIVSQN